MCRLHQMEYLYGTKPTWVTLHYDNDDDDVVNEVAMKTTRKNETFLFYRTCDLNEPQTKLRSSVIRMIIIAQ